jgi:hypothetical protein
VATASVTNNFTNGTPADAEQVDTNFADLVTFLNNSVIHRDGTKTMTANLDANSNKVINLANGTAASDAINKGQLDASAIFVCTSSTRPGSPTEGRFIYETDTDLLYVWTGTAWLQMASGTGWTSYTPQVDQGASTNIAKTVEYSKYVRIGRTIIWNFRLTMTAGGTGGNGLRVSLPVTSAVGGSYAPLIGDGHIYDSDTNTPYSCELLLTSSTAVGFIGDSTSTSSWGSAPSLAIASGDTVYGCAMYEAAS